MDKFKKFIKSLKLVAPQGIYSLGLVINKSGKRVMWAKLPYKIVKIEINDNSDYLEVLKEIYKALKSGQWLILNIKSEIPAQVYAQLRQLSLNNHLQITHKDKLIDLKQHKKSRIIFTGTPELIKLNELKYAGFKNIFGPAIII